MNKPHWRFVCLLVALILSEPCALALTNGRTDVNTPQANAVVNLKGVFLCTGALVAPDVVLSANHCWLSTPPTQGAALPIQQAEGWHPFAKEEVEVRFGHDKERFLYRVRATHYSVAGVADVRLLRLEAPVPDSIARPLPVLTRPPSAASQSRYWLQQKFEMVGWGQIEATQGSLPRFRQIADAERGQNPCRASLGKPDPQFLCTHNRNRAQLLPGDSGAPLLWTDPATGIRYVIGVGSSTTVHGGSYTATFYRGASGRNGKAPPDIGGWLERMLCASAQDRCPAAPPAGMPAQRVASSPVELRVKPLAGAVSFELGKSVRHARLMVLDLAGRRVFESGWVEPAELIWDDSLQMANGVYLIVVQVVDLKDRLASKVGKLVVVK